MDDTTGTPAAPVVDDTPVTDADLDKAAADAVLEEPVTPPDAEPDVLPDAELDEDGLPVDHKARSDLGRKFSALHKRQDGFDEKLDKLLDVLSKNPTAEEDIDELDDVGPVTKADLEKWFTERTQQEKKQKTVYQSSYDNTLATLSGEYSDKEANAIFNELTTMTYNPTSNAERDAEINFLKAERAYLRKKTATPVKDVPLKKDPVTGVVTSQKTVTKESASVKLTPAAQSYLSFIAKKDGDEQAKKVAKGL